MEGKTAVNLALQPLPGHRWGLGDMGILEALRLPKARPCHHLPGQPRGPVSKLQSVTTMKGEIPTRKPLQLRGADMRKARSVALAVTTSQERPLWRLFQRKR